MDKFAEIQYDLLRIPYDPDAKTWGEPEMLVSHEQSKLSVTHPKVSPDGKYVLFCMAKFGNFSILRKSSDLYLLDVETKQYKALDAVNSDQCESYHSWSSNGRWFVFSSKRNDGTFTRLYFAHCDEQGKVSKPVMLPQEDPLFYDSYLNIYNVPQLITGPVTVSNRALANAVRNTDDLTQINLHPDLRARISGKAPEPEDPGLYSP